MSGADACPKRSSARGVKLFGFGRYMLIHWHSGAAHADHVVIDSNEP